MQNAAANTVLVRDWQMSEGVALSSHGLVVATTVTIGTIGDGTGFTDSYLSSAATWSGKQDGLMFGATDTNIADDRLFTIC